MTLLIFALLVLIVCGLCCWAITALPLQRPFNVFAQVIICLIGVIVIAQKAGVF